MPLPLSIACMIGILTGGVPYGTQQSRPAPPQPRFQGDFFGEMPRVFCVVQSVDSKARTLTVKLDRDGQTRVVPIRDDTELHVRDSWGELTDYFPGQHVMLFMYSDEEKRWTYPRAVQDDIHMRARHNHFARVTKIDPVAYTYDTEREEKSGQQTRTVHDTIACAPNARVWKGGSSKPLESLQRGDEVIQQLAERDGKLVAIDILDRKGDDFVRALQDTRHRADQDHAGLPAVVNDVEPTTGSVLVSVAWSGADRARSDLHEGDKVAVAPSDGTIPLGATICSLQAADTRERLQLFVNARSAARLAPGQSIRVFLPGTGHSVPSGRYGPPAAR